MAPRKKLAAVEAVEETAPEAPAREPRILPPLEVFDDLDQGTPEWLAIRRGIITASEFGSVMTNGRGGAPSKTRVTYARRIASDILGAQSIPMRPTFEMMRGTELEPEIRSNYEFVHDTEVGQTGFMRRGRAGYSPDGLVGDDGLLEIKTHNGTIHLGIVLDGGFPEEHFWQCAFGLWVSGRLWIDLQCESPGLPPYQIRMHRDETVMEQISQAVEEFNVLVDQIIADFRAATSDDQSVAIAAE